MGRELYNWLMQETDSSRLGRGLKIFFNVEIFHCFPVCSIRRAFTGSKKQKEKPMTNFCRNGFLMILLCAGAMGGLMAQERGKSSLNDAFPLDRSLYERDDSLINQAPGPDDMTRVRYDAPETPFILDGHIYQPEEIVQFQDMDLYFFYDPYQEMLAAFFSGDELAEFVKDLSVRMKNDFVEYSRSENGVCYVTRPCYQGSVSCYGTVCFSDGGVCGGFVYCDGVTTNCSIPYVPNRWVYGGCCNLGGPIRKVRYREQEQICGVWSYTGLTRCNDTCLIP